ncbi:hypothetical protein LMG31841_04730 [Paraburkholderia saeva]|uniref:Uncharacterized protein n=1 Tax=Paraburkholderia saeva TaxID=2777537 RepID=A0A9N8S1I3_9BURK|nr:hypothetical protein LMG31841_04730 [Paraburkholderia saeva]
MAAAIALVAWLAFAAQTDVTIGRMLARGYGVIDGLERMSSYLTNLTVLICAICFSCVATRARPAPLRFFRKPPVVTAIVVYVVFVGLAYNLLLRFLWTPSGYRALLNETLHTIVPLLAALYWVLFVPRFHLRLRQCLLWLVYSALVPVRHVMARQHDRFLSVLLHQRRRTRLPAGAFQRDAAGARIPHADGHFSRHQPPAAAYIGHLGHPSTPILNASLQAPCKRLPDAHFCAFHASCSAECATHEKSRAYNLSMTRRN